jgi:iron complex transport system substrate-binding protein
VVAVSTYCEFPPEVANLPRVGGWTNTNLEQVLALDPGLVILSDAQAPLVEGKLHQLGLETLVVGSQSLQDIYDAIDSIGRAVGNVDEAKQLSGWMRSELESIEAAVRGRPKPRALVVVDRLPGTLRDIYIATGGSYLISLVEIAGGRPIAPPAKHEYAQISIEALATFDPEVVFDMVQALTTPVAVPGLSELAEDPVAVWKNLEIQAVKDGRVYAITDRRFVHPSQFAVEAARTMARRLHPEAFPERAERARPVVGERRPRPERRAPRRAREERACTRNAASPEARSAGGGGPAHR